MGGPKRWLGLPYRGPVGLSTACLTAAALSRLSGGGGPRLMALYDSSRNGETYPGWQNEKMATPPCILLHSRHLRAWLQRLQFWFACKNVPCDNRSCGPLGNAFTTRSPLRISASSSLLRIQSYAFCSESLHTSANSSLRSIACDVGWIWILAGER